MTLDELIVVLQAAKAGKTIEFEHIGRPTVWEQKLSSDTSWNLFVYNYRVKPEPKRVPLEAKDIPPVCWIRDPNGFADTNRLVITVAPAGIVAADDYRISYTTLMNRYEYSTDRVNWKPCWKEA